MSGDVLLVPGSLRLIRGTDPTPESEVQGVLRLPPPHRPYPWVRRALRSEDVVSRPRGTLVTVSISTPTTPLGGPVPGTLGPTSLPYLPRDPVPETAYLSSREILLSTTVRPGVGSVDFYPRNEPSFRPLGFVPASTPWLRPNSGRGGGWGCDRRGHACPDLHRTPVVVDVSVPT